MFDTSKRLVLDEHGIPVYPMRFEEPEWVCPHPLPDQAVIDSIEVERDNRQDEDD